MKEEKLRFIYTSEENLSLYHFGLGTYIRNKYLINESELYLRLKKIGIDDVDEMPKYVIIFLNNCESIRQYHIDHKPHSNRTGGITYVIWKNQ